jgi:hypothetical protein
VPAVSAQLQRASITPPVDDGTCTQKQQGHKWAQDALIPPAACGQCSTLGMLAADAKSDKAGAFASVCTASESH